MHPRSTCPTHCAGAAFYAILSKTHFTDEEAEPPSVASVLKLGGCVDDFSRKNLHKVPKSQREWGNEAIFFFFFK